MIDEIAINLYYFENCTNVEHIRRKCNPTLHYSKFTFNKRIISGVRAFGKFCPKIKRKWWASYYKSSHKVFLLYQSNFCFFTGKYLHMHSKIPWSLKKKKRKKERKERKTLEGSGHLHTESNTNWLTQYHNLLKLNSNVTL